MMEGRGAISARRWRGTVRDIGVNSTYEDMVNSSCSSCEIHADKSAYWTPLLYYHYPNGSFYEVPHFGSVVYYLGRGPNVATTIPFPPGLQILSGNKAARSYDNQTLTWGNAEYPGQPIADRVSFLCLTAGDLPPNMPYMYNATQCVNGMRAQIAFQSCWDGIHNYTTDNSHVAYLSGIDNGICPPNYPYQFPTIFVETLYAVTSVPEGTDDDRFVFSQGDPTGYGFHGDFINGWDMDVQTEAVNNCLYNGAPDGVIQECPVLNQQDSNGYPENCPERPPQIGEPVKGLLTQLPGCIEITYGPEAAPAASMQCPASVALPSITPTPMGMPLATASPVPGQPFGLPEQIYMGCYNDTGGTPGFKTLNGLFYSNYTNMTVEFCQNYCMANGYRFSGVEYAQECHCDNEINPTAIMAPNGTVNQCTWNCGGTMTLGDVEQEFCGGLQYIDIYKNVNTSFVAFGNNDNTAGNAQPYTPPSGFGSNYLGCWQDNAQGTRLLDGDMTAAQYMNLTVCADFCAAGNNGFGFQYYGTEFGNQCFCGNEITNTSAQLTATTTPTNQTCQMRCYGAEPEICGGPSAVSLYNNTAYVPPVVKPSIGKYVSQGCLVDPNGPGGRAIQGNDTRSADMTIEKCIKFCLGSYYHYAGIEYAAECYCGNEILPETQTGGHLAQCNITDMMRCAGNVYEYCGGPGFMDLYYSASL
ncbi:hypothetical protein BAUCODRAFT_463088 [Baudoinia panamericana UAMH 10762]|uniref:WSC domain-containing protein n=1 Tax=Baudoinia panamericana (strain UAMH 10762) TaxID=717646 RepID=M2NEN0_BAUPA|nr:uncharacterized protein BAUCODRAFT_463088 [Baudoinia panamericana UAMH 10762]EMC97704.1 hypothetical protein BAUCODRAFT_463088 [Baudoinia panamericana UAMH 10762]